ncbi:MAG: hypothetical protein Q4G42_01440 [Neisseria sp.]|nr:hypothetical protein [Neisseria sp.]
MNMKKTVMALSLTLCASAAWAFPLSQAEGCKADQVGTVGEMFACGSIDGSIRLNSYSLNNAYFGNTSQDTTSIGGYATYKTAPFYGFQAAVGIEGQRRLAEGAHAVGELHDHEFGLSEAYVKWQRGKFAVTVGNQRLNLPFVGDYANFRVLPFLYQGVDMKYGDNDTFVRATKVHKYKSYATSEFNQGSRLKDDPFSGFKHETNGMLALGAGKKIQLGEHYVKGQLWAERYHNLLDIYYGDVLYGMNNVAWKPEIGVQAIYGTEREDALLGKVNGKIVGIQAKLKPTDKINWKIAYNHMFSDGDAWRNGSLPTPYAHNTSSGPIFAQPFFTSTQNLGAGNAFSTELSANINASLTAGGRLTHVRASTVSGREHTKMTEYLAFASYRFQGKLKGLSISNHIGAQKRQGTDDPFWQNRLNVTYSF